MRVRAFVDELRDLVRGATVDEIIDALHHKAAPARRAAAPAATTTRRDARKVAAPRRPANAPIEATKPRRTRDFMALLMARVHAHIKANRGQGAGQIAAAVDSTAPELTYLLRKLLDEKKITSEGQKRHTRYFPR